MFMASTAYQTSTLVGELIEKMNKLSPTDKSGFFIRKRPKDKNSGSMRNEAVEIMSR